LGASFNLRGNNYTYTNVPNKCPTIFGMPICFEFMKTNIFTRTFNMFNVKPIGKNNFNESNATESNATESNATESNAPTNIIKPNVSYIQKEPEELDLINYSNIEERNTCYSPEDFDITLPFKFDFFMDAMYPNITYKYFKYSVFYNLGCPYYTEIGLQPSLTTLNIPISIKDKYQKLQNIVIERLFGGLVDNSTIRIYNPRNTLHIKDGFISLVNNVTLYIFPWMVPVKIEQINYLNYVHIEHKLEYTYLHIPILKITKIKILFSHLTDLTSVENIENFLAQPKNIVN